ncbi:hypothetical protein [Oceanicoccus sp. KOV_DT_Chl]|uniref:hypothetical protein n=1 Tax=Oceanicoccus sp. KOV_DT_Chl TaxID=1904639 RepID=UPI0011AF48A8|nr:hypothetical protein [Oceanicoccus sp. KOV_DT_Chl]
MSANSTYTTSAKILHGSYFIIIFFCCLMMPYWQFGVVPFVSDRTDGPVYTDQEVILSPITAADALEEDVMLNEFKWCRYCHVMQEGGLKNQAHRCTVFLVVRRLPCLASFIQMHFWRQAKAS